MTQGAAPVVDPFLLVGTTLDGRFRVDRRIAEGGFGVVYCGTQTALDRPVALKVLKAPPGFEEEAGRQFRERFADEAKTIARINHPHIVDVYDFGISRMPGGQLAPWMALEWLGGETLEAQLARRRGRGGRTAPEVLALVEPVLEALTFVHGRGVAHRDVKPANVMVLESGTLKLLDFGIAKLMTTDEVAGTGMTRTASGLAAFSPLYASPEQASFGRTGPWTDVHALGLLLVELLTDQSPFSGEGMELFQQVLAPERPTPRVKRRHVGGWEPVLEKALAIQPAHRWKDAGELLEALRASVPADDRIERPAGPEAFAATLPGSVGGHTPVLPVVRTREAARPRPRWPLVAAAILIAGAAAAVALTRRAPPVVPHMAGPAARPPPAAAPAPAPAAPPPTAALPVEAPAPPAAASANAPRRRTKRKPEVKPPPAPSPPVPAPPPKKQRDFVVE